MTSDPGVEVLSGGAPGVEAVGDGGAEDADDEQAAGGQQAAVLGEPGVLQLEVEVVKTESA